MNRTTPRLTDAPRGFTLVELLVAATLLAVVLGAVVTLAASQQRTYAALAATRAARSQLQGAALVLARELRPLATRDSADGGDVRAVSDSVVEIASVTGGAVACSVPDAWTVDLPPTHPERDVSLAWWSTPPRAGDALLAFDAGASAAAGDDRWLAFTVDDVATPADACAGSVFVSDRDGAPAYRLALSGPAPLPPTVGPGAPVRLSRGRRWVHYRGGDGAWYLGLREWDGAAWSETQPVAGPLRARGRPAGLAFAADDSAGASADPRVPNAVSTLRAVLRATPRVSWRGTRAAARVESVRVQVAPRLPRQGAP